MSRSAPAQSPGRHAARLAVAVMGVHLVVATATWLPASAQNASSSTTAKPTTTAKASSTSTSAKASTTSRASSTSGPTSSQSGRSSSTASTATGASAGSVTTPEATGSVPFPAEIVAPMVLPTSDRARAISDLYVTPGSETNTTTVVVKFREPFDLPRSQYRISVVLGKPDGDRVRSSLTTNGGPTPEGKVERWRGDAYQWISTAEVSFDPSGLVGISVAADIAPSGALWAEVEVGGNGGEITTTPYFPQDALLGRIGDGKLTAGSYGRRVHADGTVDPEPVPIEGGPVLSAVNQGVTLTSETRPPEELAGRGVVAAVDVVLLAPDFTRGGVLADEMRVDRTTGTVSLIKRRVLPQVDDRTDAPNWLVQGLPPEDPGAPAVVSFSLPDVARGVDVELGDAAALGLRREFTLDDGSTVIADALLGTLGWFDRGAVAAAAATETSPPSVAPKGPLVAGGDDSANQQRTLLIAVGAGVGILVFASLVVMLRRRRITAPVRPAPAASPRAQARAHRRRRKGDAADVLQTMAEDMDELRRTGQIAAITGSSPPRRRFRSGDPEVFAPVTGQQPVVVLTGEVPAVSSASPGASPGAPVATVPGGDPPPDVGPEPEHAPSPFVTREDIEAGRVATAEVTTEGDEQPERPRAPRARRTPATDPLAMLGDVDDLSARLERLAPTDPDPDSQA